jgi:hypothetical protein
MKTYRITNYIVGAAVVLALVIQLASDVGANVSAKVEQIAHAVAGGKR